ncbi:MAG: SEC-C metal-binding domain-containing protein [bacterium]
MPQVPRPRPQPAEVGAASDSQPQRLPDEAVRPAQRAPQQPPAAAERALASESPVDPASIPVVGRNEPCPCGSGLKYRQCHGKKPDAQA